MFHVHKQLLYPGRIHTRSPTKQTATDLHLTPHGYWDWLTLIHAS